MKNIMRWALIIGGIVLTIILSVAGVKSFGIIGIIVGPLVLFLILKVFSWIYS